MALVPGLLLLALDAGGAGYKCPMEEFNAAAKRESINMKPWFLAVLVIFQLAAPLLAAGRPITVDDLLGVKGVADPQLSPDGSLIVYVVAELDRATDKNNSSLWLVPAAGGQPKQLTTAPGANNHPRWCPDGKSIAFVSHRSGSDQVWLLPIDGGEPRQLTKLPIDVSGPVWSPKGDKLAFTAEVYPGLTPEQTAVKDKEKEASKTKVRVYDRLMIRHWKAWDEGKRSHLFVADAQTGESTDLTPKLEVNTPALFGGSSDYAWSPDGERTRSSPPSPPRTPPGRPIPTSGPFPSTVASPRTSPPATWAPMLNRPILPDLGVDRLRVPQTRAGFESDRWVLKVISRSSQPSLDLTKTLDRPALTIHPWASWWNQAADHRRYLDRTDRRDRFPFEKLTPPLGSTAPALPSAFYAWQLMEFSQAQCVSREKRALWSSRITRAQAPAEVFIAGPDGSRPGRNSLTTMIR